MSDPSGLLARLPRPIVQKTLTRRQKEVIPKLLMHRLTAGGQTIDELGTKLAGEQAQQRLRSARVWHTKAELDAWVADQLRLPPSLWGPERKSNDLMTATTNEIMKMRRRGELVDWHRGKRLNVFRLSNPSKRADLPAMSSGQGEHQPLVESTDAAMRGLFMSIISRSRKDNTYKFALGKTLLDYCKANIPDGTAKEIPYDYLAGEFLRHYWYQRFKFRMKQDFHTKKQPVVIHILEDIFGDRPPALYKDIPDDKLQMARKRILDDIFGHAKSKKGMVVPRFQKTMDGSTTRDNNLFYDYDDDERKITLHPKAHSFFRRNNHVLTQALLAEWVLYLEKANHGLPLLASKIMAQEMRRGPLTTYRNMLYEKTHDCFYCLKSFNKSGMHVDHFIPFSYIYDDNAWNLVLSCAECNLSKRDSLPSVKPYFVELVERNEKYSASMSRMRLSLLQLSARGKNTWKKEMRHHYNICAEYGFGRWGYTRSVGVPEAPMPTS